jgi:hypothetical protein
VVPSISGLVHRTGAFELIRCDTAGGKPWDAVNGLAASALLNLTASVRFEGNLNVDLNDITTNLVPFPQVAAFVLLVCSVFVCHSSLNHNALDNLPSIPPFDFLDIYFFPVDESFMSVIGLTDNCNLTLMLHTVRLFVVVVGKFLDMLSS